MHPKISVVMSVLNGERFLQPAIESVLNQGFKEFEFVIIDNASTDTTPKILDSYSDERIVRLRNERVLTLTESLNIGLRAARGEYVARLDADDFAAPCRLERQVAFLDNHPDVLLVGSHARIIDESGTATGMFAPTSESAELYDRLAYSNPFAHSSCAFRRKAVLLLGGYPLEYSYAQDVALWIALARNGKLAVIPEPLVDFREHSGQTTHSPLYAFTRHSEAITIYKSAQTLPGLSVYARRRGRKNLIKLHLIFARDLLRSGRSISALREIAASIGSMARFAFSE